MERNGSWMQTYSGKQFWPMDPRADEINIVDIAHSLSLQCRYAGHCKQFYSVAEHSVLVSRACSPQNKLWGLLHDASEAYLVDVPRPIKPYLPGYKEAEAAVMDKVCSYFGLVHTMPDEIHYIDVRIVEDECKQNMALCDTKWDYCGPPIGVELKLWSPRAAEEVFLAEYELLRIQNA